MLVLHLSRTQVRTHSSNESATKTKKLPSKMIQKFLQLQILLLPTLIFGWLDHRIGAFHRVHTTSTTGLRSEPTPCWQEMYDEDCSMDHAYAASFVASEWLKRMPCASGLEDCDIPNDLKLPGNRPEAGEEDVDVLSFLNLKRAPSVDSKPEGEGLAP